MAAEAATRPSTSCSVFKLKHHTPKKIKEEVFEKKKPSSRPATTTKSVASRPHTSASLHNVANNMRFGSYSKSSFFSRHNPHPVRVRHIRGLNGVPICSVNDDGYFPSPRFSLDKLNLPQQKFMLDNHVMPNALGLNSSMFPIDIITGIQSYPYKEKAVPRFGLIPITDTWRDELKDFCHKAGLIKPHEHVEEQQKPPPSSRQKHRQTVYSATTGRLIPPQSRMSSRASNRPASQQANAVPFNHISVYPDSETLMLNMLCQILQTESIPDVQQWLVSAGEREKNMVLDLIRSGIGTKTDPAPQQQDPPESRAPTAASHRSLMSAASNRNALLDGDVAMPTVAARSACQSRASSVRSVRPLGTLPKNDVVIIEEGSDVEE